MSNLKILELNIMSGIATEEGKDLFLRGKDRNILQAEKCAWEWDKIYGFISEIREFLEQTYTPKAIIEIIEFIKERQFRRYFPQGRTKP